MRPSFIAACVFVCNGLMGCATPRSVIELPSCADRVEITGQAQRVSPTRFELDHTFDLMLTRTQLSFQSGGNVNDVILESNQPDPLRLFFGVGLGVGGALLLTSASYDVAHGLDPFSERPFFQTLGGGALLGTGTAMAITGWHPAQSYVTFPDACGGADAARAGPRVIER